MADLPDVNLWVGLSVVGHPFQRSAQAYWAEEASERIVFCRVTALGLARVCSGKMIVGGPPLSMSEAWGRYQEWRRAQGVEFRDEPEGIDAILESWIERGIVVHKDFTDAYLAAFAVSAGLRLVSFDEDFERFPGLDLLRLT